MIPGAYRQFTGDIVFADAQNTEGVPNVYADPAAVLKDLHAYSSWVLASQKAFYLMVAPEWFASVSKLLSELAPLFSSGRAALVRLGKNNGAESYTAHMIDEETSLPRCKKPSLTAFITRDTEAKFNAQPFGWAVIEADPVADATPLKKWCAARNVADAARSVAEEWSFVREIREKRLKAVLASKANEEAVEARRREEAKRAEEAERVKATLSPQAREAAEVCEALEKAPGVVQPGWPLFIRVKELLTEAEAWTNAEEKKALALRIQPLLKKKDMFRGKAEKEFKRQLKNLRGEG